MTIAHLSLTAKGSAGQVTKVVDQPCCHLQQSAVYLPQGSRTGWQLSFHDFTLVVIQGYGHLLSQGSQELLVNLAPACWVAVDSHTPYQVEAEEDLLLLVTTVIGVEDLHADLNWLSMTKPQVLMTA